MFNKTSISASQVEEVQFATKKKKKLKEQWQTQPVGDSENCRSIMEGTSGVPTACLLSRPLRGTNDI